ncbi:MAG: hypothetical protein ACK452_05260, partial [Bacteroidota bacterium]
SIAHTKSEIIDQLKSAIAKFDGNDFREKLRTLDDEFASINSDPLIESDEKETEIEYYNKLTKEMNNMLDNPVNADELLANVESQTFTSEFTRIVGLNEHNRLEEGNLKGEQQTFLMEFRSNEKPKEDDGYSSYRDESYKNLIQDRDITLPVQQPGSFS